MAIKRLLLPLIGLLSLGVSSWILHTYFTSTYEARYNPKAPTPRTTVGFEAPEEKTLGIEDYLSLGGPYQSFLLRAQVRVETNGVLEFILRQESAKESQFLVLTLSGDPTLPTRFTHASHIHFKPSPNAKDLSLPTEKWIDLEIIAEGAQFRASLDGEEFDHAWCWEYSEGLCAVAGLQGTCHVRALSVQPKPWPKESPKSQQYRLLGIAVALTPWLGAGLIGALLRWGSRRRFLTLLSSQGIGFVLASLYLLKLVNDQELVASSVGLILSLGLLLVGQTVTIFLCGKRLKFLALLLALLMSGALALGLALLISPRLQPDPTTQANLITHYKWEGLRLEPSWVWYQHPLIRRWNRYLSDRCFRDQRPALEPAPNTERILILGTSSTWGHGYDPSQRAEYPAKIADLFTQENHRVEVINGAIPGSTGSRLYLFFRERLIHYQPDVVVLSLRFNDAAALSQFDERQYYRNIAEEGFQKTLGHQIQERWALRERQQSFQENRHRDSLWDFGQQACNTFAQVLGDFRELCLANDTKLLLIKEPLREETGLTRGMGAAMLSFGETNDVPVLEIGPSLEGQEGLFLDVVHPNEKGHQLIADALFNKLNELEWVR